MADEFFLAEISMVAFPYAPTGHALCNGQLLPISSNQALFSLLGTTYGGDGVVTFALPDFRGRCPVHFGSEVTLGQASGLPVNKLSADNIPAHSHTLNAAVTLPVAPAGNSDDPAGHYLAPGTTAYFGTAADEHMATISAADLGMPATTENYVSTGDPYGHLMPSLVVNFIISLRGIFPSQT
ncbi:phage tail protein [Chitinophaga solisilvae]|uniref:phage tail protein n=1 Tax=Chitinophaga solisilvae TaxID=1233460 RepID=UPI00136F0835|nr:tail fiber protein [Chitinophaga solisilvae]